jgi:hypothetical protein
MIGYTLGKFVKVEIRSLAGQIIDISSIAMHAD